MRFHLAFFVVAAATLLACDEGPRRGGAGGNSAVPAKDASVRADVLVTADASAQPDAQPRVDVGKGTDDAGSSDAGFVDAGHAPRDASTPNDTGTAPHDSGTVHDAGNVPHDAGTMPPHDAGTTAPDAGTAPTGVPILGNGTHSITAVQLDVIAAPSVGHVTPTDLAFHPHRPGELWVIDQGDNSVWIAANAGTPQQSAVWRLDAQSGSHFLARPSSLAFGANGNFATSQDEDRITQATTPSDFMGPTLWSSDLQIFDAGHAGHLDMLHNSPAGKGVAWEQNNVYWIFDGHHASITRYDFASDHGPGGSDHSDGIVARFAEGQVQEDRVVPSHLDLHHATNRLFIADTGNNRIAVLDISSGTAGAAINPNYDGTQQYRMDGATITTLIDGAQAGLQKPCGLELHDGKLFVSDNQQSRFYAFDLNGTLLDYLDTGLPAGSLMGFDFDAQGNLWFVDAAADRVLRISP